MIPPSPANLDTTSDANPRSGFVAAALACVVIVALVLLSLAPAHAGAFLNWDDDRNIVLNGALHSPAPPLRWVWQTYHLGVWQPLAWLLYWAQWRLGDGRPGPFHSVSLFWHAANCLLLFFLVIRILRRTIPTAARASTNAATLASLLVVAPYAVHPLRVEPAAWISCQPYLPAVFFYLLAVFVYIGAAPCRPWPRLAAALGFFCVALGFKAVAISLPLVLLVLDRYPLRRPERLWRLILEKIPLFAVAVPVALWALHAKDFNQSRVPLGETAIVPRLLQSGYAVAFYLAKTIAPRGLSPYYQLPSDAALTTALYILVSLAVLAATVVLIALARKTPALLAAWLAYLIILLPNVGLVQISRQIASDRYAYLASVPWVVLAAAALSTWLHRPRRFARHGLFATSLALLAIAACLLATRRQCAHWRSSVALWSHAVALDPDSAVAHCNLGAAELAESHWAAASQHLSRAIDLEPDFSFAFANFAVVLSRAGRYDQAIAAAQQALGAQPPLAPADQARTHAVLGEAYAALRQDDLAWRHTLKAKQLGFAPAERMIDYLRKFSRDPREKKGVPPTDH